MKNRYSIDIMDRLDLPGNTLAQSAASIGITPKTMSAWRTRYANDVKDLNRRSLHTKISEIESKLEEIENAVFYFDELGENPKMTTIRITDVVRKKLLVIKAVEGNKTISDTIQHLLNKESK